MEGKTHILGRAIARISIVAMLVAFLGIAAAPVDGAEPKIRIPRGPSVKIDGTLLPAEWRNAEKVQIEVAADWKVEVWAQHDDRNLYFAFRGVKHGARRIFPEVLIDPGFTRSEKWQKGQWWFHVSYNLCEGNGEHDLYQQAGVFQCSHTKPGWEGNNPPQETTETVELRISFEKVGMTYHPEAKIGLALEVTNATDDTSQTWKFWPKRAELESPSTWATAIVE
jgi:hypothetical protein